MRAGWKKLSAVVLASVLVLSGCGLVDGIREAYQAGYEGRDYQPGEKNSGKKEKKNKEEPEDTQEEDSLTGKTERDVSGYEAYRSIPALGEYRFDPAGKSFSGGAGAESVNPGLWTLTDERTFGEEFPNGYDIWRWDFEDTYTAGGIQRVRIPRFRLAPSEYAGDFFYKELQVEFLKEPDPETGRVIGALALSDIDFDSGKYGVKVDPKVYFARSSVSAPVHSGAPVFIFQALNPGKLSGIVGDDSVSQRPCMGGDHGISVADPQMPQLQISINIAKMFCRFRVEIQNTDPGKKLVNTESVFLRLPALFYAVFQFPQSNCGDTKISSDMLLQSGNDRPIGVSQPHDDRIGIKHIHHNVSLTEGISSGLPSAIKSSETIAAPWRRVFTRADLGVSIRVFPILFMNSSSSSNRYSAGMRTAWLLPFMNTFVVWIVPDGVI